MLFVCRNQYFFDIIFGLESSTVCLILVFFWVFVITLLCVAWNRCQLCRWFLCHYNPFHDLDSQVYVGDTQICYRFYVLLNDDTEFSFANVFSSTYFTVYLMHLLIINYITSLHVLFQFINLEAEKKSGIINFYLIFFFKITFSFVCV